MNTIEIIYILNKYNITDNYYIKSGIVNVNGDVYLGGNIKEIPVKFGIVKGDFYCHDSNLTSLKNFPSIVEGDVYLYNSKLTTLKGSELSTIKGNLYISNNELKSLNYCPKVLGDIDVSYNKIRTLKGINKINGDLICYHNNIKEINNINIKQNLVCYENKNIKINKTTIVGGEIIDRI